ncbi:gamma carbonic anhydrase family protein [Nocardia blacklockiae]|uniref:gamma carbonic anhydrase family protein n=1 Tax=Nocardia blacklockiae TaxID=480036 RepID=UPI0018949497|nr:gamma carbonic anhydrase family protein [Nocardia blacklockiae]MBF6175609.1 gamma carbonic anhydrase family protein [Nocardia blacklockiae]
MRIQLGEHAPEIADSAWVAPNATVIGRVRLAAEVSVWYSAVIRGDLEEIAVGAGSNIQDGCVLHADPGFPLTVGTGVSVGHNAILHGCTVGDDVLVGMGATVLNGAVIGAGSLIAANALIPEGAQIPPGSLVAGVPGKVRRELGEAERDRIRLNAAVYRHNTTTHRDGVEV